METLNRRPWLVAVATLVIGVALGFGVSTATSRSASASAAAKGTTVVEKSDLAKVKPRPAIASTSTDDSHPFAEMQRMRHEVDRVIRRATDNFRLDRNADMIGRDFGFTSSLDVRDKKDHFEVSAYLPDAEASDVKVATERDNMLRVTVNHKKEEKKEGDDGESTFSELGRYEQLVTLPAPIKSEDMKVERNGHELLIKVPKAQAS